jgi:S1-C subfamily serine protease
MRILALSVALSALVGFASPASAAPNDALAQARAEEQTRIKLIDKVSRAFVAIGGGSGIIVSADGEILTNDHVAGSRDIGATWVVIQPGGVFKKATLIAKDPRGDIALLKMIDKGPYPYVELGDSDALLTGQAVVALGNPFGFSKNGTPHVSHGVVSVVHRNQGGYSDAIQTDTAINPGNSGGPLITYDGKLVGINGRIAVRFGTRANTGVGYAIPTNQIRAFLPDLRAGGVVSHGRIQGLRLTDTNGNGAKVRSVSPGSAADLAGLESGDVIVEADGRPVHSPHRFNGIVGTLPAGASLRVKAKRGDEIVDGSLDLASRDRKIITKGAYLGVVMSTGDVVEIEEVMPSSPAHRAGLQSGDVLRLIDGQRIRSSRTVVTVVGAKKPGDTVTLTVLRGETNLELKIELGKRPR